MAYHETFWVVVGTAAPVIALAAVVATTDETRVSLGAIDTNLDEIEDDRLLRWTMYSGMWMGQVTILLQAVILVFALLSLGASKDKVPLLVPEIALPAGILMLFSTSITSAVLRVLPSLLGPDNDEAQEPPS